MQKTGHWRFKQTFVRQRLLQDEECLRPGEATDLTFLDRLEDKMGTHPHFVT